MLQTSLFFPELQTSFHFRIILFRVIEHALPMGCFDRVGFIGVLADPITDFSISEGITHYVHKDLSVNASGFQPPPVKALAQIGLVIGVQFPGKMQTQLIDETRQVHPPAHRLSWAAWINNVAPGAEYSVSQNKCQSCCVGSFGFPGAGFELSLCV